MLIVSSVLPESTIAMSSHHVRASRHRGKLIASLNVSRRTETFIQKSSFGNWSRPYSNDFRRIANDDRPIVDVSHRPRARSTNAISPDLHPRPDKAVRANPRTLSDRDRELQQRQVCPQIIMRSGAKMSALGNRGPCPDRNKTEIV